MIFYDNHFLKEKLRYYYPDFEEDVLMKGMEKFQVFNLNAGDYILSVGEISDKIFIAEKSISRLYMDMESGEENTLWIEPEKNFITDFESFKLGAPSKYNIQVYEDTDVYCICKKDLRKLCVLYKDWALFSVYAMEERFYYAYMNLSHFHFNDATENYLMIEKLFPRFLQVVPLKHIASRLNVSPITISRIRAGNQKLKK